MSKRQIGILFYGKKVNKVLKAKTKDDKALKVNDRGLNIKSIIFTLKDI